ncbi:MAG: cell wall hydrolase [Lachnospiraceae bacterium]|nr:cell wall hydrolase [Lachnospiraceae bacterium]
MNYKLYAGLATAGLLILASAIPSTISAETLEDGLQELSAVESYERILDDKIVKEAEPLQESLAKIDLTTRVQSLPAKRLYNISDTDFQVLSRIVEAEATDKDMKSKILVANVILNRWKSGEFPDTIQEVVFQRENGAVQFSPTADGRYYSVHVTESSRESVDRALKGEDYSEGALYFVERSIADPKNVSWFDRALTKLFEYQGHAFYK